jgi:hypothetical protein
MKIRIALALIVAGTFASQGLAGEKFIATRWNGVAYRKGQFVPGDPDTGRPPLVSRTTWKSEKTARGTVIRVGKGYLTAGKDGIVYISPKLTSGSYWVMRKVESRGSGYSAPDDWKGTWQRTTYTLEPLAPGLKGGKLGITAGKLTVHPENEGLAILSVTKIDAREISGK